MSAEDSAWTTDAPATRHERLRAATGDAHARLHLHPGFNAIQDGTISLAGYRALLARLLGFYLPFEAETGIGNERSSWLTADLCALGGAAAGSARCGAVPRFHDEAARLGAVYLAEGALLGGRGLARKLDVLFGPDVSNGRRFFLGRGPATAPAWREFLARLTAAEGGDAAAVAAAVQTFGIFETWMEGWRARQTA